MSDNNICPVCRARQISAGVNCVRCGFDYAFIHCFSFQKAAEWWNEQAEQAKEKWKINKRKELAQTDHFQVGSSYIAYLDPTERLLLLLKGSGQLEKESQVRAFSGSERNFGVLYSDGTVRVQGTETEFGQQNTNDWRDIESILVTQQCTYGIRWDGSVQWAGIPVSNEIENWQNMKKLVGNDDMVVGILRDGSLKCTGKGKMESVKEKAESWKHIKQVRITRNAVIGLSEDGKVCFAGKESDKRASCAKWKNILSVSADQTYVYGLTEEGTVLTAGFAPAMLEKGRLGAKDWQQIIRLSANNSSVGAADENGQLKFAGSFSGDLQAVNGLWNTFVRPLADLKNEE